MNLSYFTQLEPWLQAFAGLAALLALAVVVRFLGVLVFMPVLRRIRSRAHSPLTDVVLADAALRRMALVCDGDSGLDDDGEPSGTAAKPMYNVLMHKDLMNVLAVVVRYWGGIKLGAGGLSRAYGQAISEAVKTAELQPVEPQCERRCGCTCGGHQRRADHQQHARRAALRQRRQRQAEDAQQPHGFALGGRCGHPV